MKTYVFHVKGQSKPIVLSGTLANEHGVLLVRKDGEVTGEFERKSLRAWHLQVGPILKMDRAATKHAFLN